MHMQGSPRDMQRAPRYDNVVAEIRDFFRQTFSACLACDIDPMRLAFDPGIGFGKNDQANLYLIRDAMQRAAETPIALGISRKSFIGRLLDIEDPLERGA